MSRCLVISNVRSGCLRRALKTLNSRKSSSGVGGEGEGNRKPGGRGRLRGGVGRFGTRVGDLLARRL